MLITIFRNAGFHLFKCGNFINISKIKCLRRILVVFIHFTLQKFRSSSQYAEREKINYYKAIVLDSIFIFIKQRSLCHYSFGYISCYWKLRIWSHLLKTSLMENFAFLCSVRKKRLDGYYNMF